MYALAIQTAFYFKKSKLLPYHDELKAGACFGATSGERPMWYSLNENNQNMNIVLVIKIGTHQQNMKPQMQENVGLFDLSSFAKFDLKGESVHDELQKICTANIKSMTGKTTARPNVK